jgi:hypothetical protein
MKNLREDFDYFMSNIDKLCKKHLNEFVIVKDKQFAGFFDSFDEAYNQAVVEYEIGTFLIQECKKSGNSNFYSYSLIEN